VLVSDPVLAGSDTLATARALAAALDREGPFDLVLAGRNALDADTGQVPPQLAELLDRPFVAAARELELVAEGGRLHVRTELDDGWREVEVALPAVVSTAERLCEPAKVPPAGRAAVPAERLRRLAADDLGPGPLGLAATRTEVGPVRVLEATRRRLLLEGPVAEQAAQAARLLGEWDVLAPPDDPDNLDPDAGLDRLPAAPIPGPDGRDPVIGVVVEPGRPRMARELLGEAAVLAARLGGVVEAVAPGPADPGSLSTWGADRLTVGDGAVVEEDAADLVVDWCRRRSPWAILFPGTLWGREVGARASATLDAGLVGDAVGFAVDEGRLVAWKPAFGGQLVAAVTCTSPVQLATVRPGMLSLRAPRVAQALEAEPLAAPRRGRVTVLGEGRDDEVTALVAARAVVAVGAGVDPADYPRLEPLRAALGAELGASRKVTDRGWMPRARQIGVTGHSVSPAVFVAVGISGKFNHMVGARAAGVIVAVNEDRSAPVFEWADIGLVADWREAVPLLAEALVSATVR
jgi:electron transfer flavoprotein alpha subunit